jgi:ABC-type phosphate transport system substrate-binding protein
MKVLSVRGLVPTCLVSAAAVAALASPGSALASVGVQCSGSNVAGQGSSLQALAQQKVFDPEFNISTAKKACNGKYGDKLKPEVSYTSTGSGGAMTSLGFEETQAEQAEKEAKKEENKGKANFTATNAFGGTDEPPNPRQIANGQTWESTNTPESIETIPVLQGAVALIVNLPTGCTEATSKGAAGRLVLNDSTLIGIWNGSITKWSQITDDGDVLKGTGCKPSEDTITRVVRLDQSGTTHIFKRFLGLLSSTKQEFEGQKAGEEEELNYSEASEDVKNVKWPVADAVVKPSGTGGGKLVAKVAETPGSIGYSNLADARSNGDFSTPADGGGPKTARFWVMLENSSKTTENSKHELKTTFTYQDPASNKDVEASAKANCAKTVYTNANETGGEFPPASVYSNWNEVTAEVTSKTYPLCGLSYDIAYPHYSLFSGTSEKEATTVNNFEQFVLEAAGGQKLIGENRDYLALPSTGKLITEARKGATEVGF